MTWWYAVVEARHELQNPTSPDKIRLLGERLRLGPGSHVLDIASGRGGPAILLAEAFGCRLTCVERSPEFVAGARGRVAAAGLERRIELVEADASTWEPPGRYDAALCLGATFVYGGLVPTLERLRAVGVGVLLEDAADHLVRGGAGGRDHVRQTRIAQPSSARCRRR